MAKSDPVYVEILDDEFLNEHEDDAKAFKMPCVPSVQSSVIPSTLLKKK